jgi:hypothetical protein
MLLKIVQAIHGHAGVLAAVALLHPAILLRRGKPLTRANRWSLALACLLALAAFASGIFLYGPYREQVRHPLFADSLRAGFAFETKEHLALFVVSLAVGATLAAFAAPREAVTIRRTAALLFALASLLCLAVSGLGTFVQAVRGF